ncbi:MAG: hypothetical protein QOI41_3203 [Myxococcales bacterium]|nr:hypothetical protein [Myxococcales bacterium]
MKRTSKWLFALTAAALLALGIAPSGCDGSTLATPATTGPVTNPDGTTDTDAGDSDGGVATDDASASDGSPPTFDDGTPTRVACSSTLGMGLSPDHGRLDGTLVSIVPEKGAHCPSDPDHLHLQILMNGANYDIAVNLDGFEGEIDAPLPGIPFAEGWHPMDLDYAQDLGLHSTDLTVTTPATIRAHVTAQLTNANHISVFGTGYPGSDGAHLIHRKAGSRDGALVINPLGAKAHVIAFRFATDTF